MGKSFRLAAEQIEDLVPAQGWCIASDRITVDGCHVGFMYRDRRSDANDSGWRFWAGDESDSYANDPKNLAMYDVNTIANYDPAIIDLLDSPEMTAFERADRSSRFNPAPFPKDGLN